MRYPLGLPPHPRHLVMRLILLAAVALPIAARAAILPDFGALGVFRTPVIENRPVILAGDSDFTATPVPGGEKGSNGRAETVLDQNRPSFFQYIQQAISNGDISDPKAIERYWGTSLKLDVYDRKAKDGIWYTAELCADP